VRVSAAPAALVVLGKGNEGTIRLSGAYPEELDGAGGGMKITMRFRLNSLGSLQICAASPIIGIHLYKPACECNIPQATICEASVVSRFSVILRSQW